MRRHIIPFFAIALLLLAGLGIARAEQHRYDSPYLLGFYDEPDTTKVIYPIPTGGSPTENLFNKSPLYLSDPENITEEIIYDPLTGQYFSN